MSTSPQTIRIGKVVVPLEQACEWVRNYTDLANISAKKPYAYPAYDRYEMACNNPRELSDADLLAPGLLNVPIKIRSYYDLQRIRPQLEQALANIDLELPLAQLDDSRIAAIVKPLYSILDDPHRKPWNVNATTLSKVLHRKRPQALVLHDRWINSCYVGEIGPVKPAKKRTWGDYMTAITIAIRNDMCSQPAAFELLDKATSSPGALSYVRLLDIVAWTSKGAIPSEAAKY